jgi:hypothetical protein
MRKAKTSTNIDTDDGWKPRKEIKRKHRSLKVQKEQKKKRPNPGQFQSYR